MEFKHDDAHIYLELDTNGYTYTIVAQGVLLASGWIRGNLDEAQRATRATVDNLRPCTYV